MSNVIGYLIRCGLIGAGVALIINYFIAGQPGGDIVKNLGLSFRQTFGKASGLCALCAVAAIYSTFFSLNGPSPCGDVVWSLFGNHYSDVTVSDNQSDWFVATLLLTTMSMLFFLIWRGSKTSTTGSGGHH